MQDGSQLSMRPTPDTLPARQVTGNTSEIAGNKASCAFCQRSSIAANVLLDSANFLLVADHAPLVEGHILIIPKQHHTCYGAVPPEQDEELFALKREVQQFFEQCYAPIVFWEHGVFRQTVFHAHLHCFPFGLTQYTAAEEVRSRVVFSQDDIREWYAVHGHYFYMEGGREALLFAPEMERYLHVVKNVLAAGVSARGFHGSWRSQQQRHAEGGPFIQATRHKWHQFQQQGASYADRTTAR